MAPLLGAATMTRELGVRETEARGIPAPFRLRDFVESLDSDELEIVEEPVDLADVAARLEGNPKAVLFRSAGPEHQSLVGNITGSRTRLAKAFGVAAPELLGEVLTRLRRAPEIVTVGRDQAPVQEVVQIGRASCRERVYSGVVEQ